MPCILEDGCPGLLLLHLVELPVAGRPGALGGHHRKQEPASWLKSISLIERKTHMICV